MKARVRNDCRKIGNVIVHRDMEKYFGKVLEFVPDDSNEKGWYINVHIGNDIFVWRWHESWLDFIPEIEEVKVISSPFQLKYFVFNKFSIVRYYTADRVTYVSIHTACNKMYEAIFSGHAICDYSDTFSLVKGIKIACFNALQFDKFNVPEGKESKREAKTRVAELQRRRNIYSSIRNTLRGGLA